MLCKQSNGLGQIFSDIIKSNNQLLSLTIFSRIEEGFLLVGTSPVPSNGNLETYRSKNMFQDFQ